MLPLEIFGLRTYLCRPRSSNNFNFSALANFIGKYEMPKKISERQTRLILVFILTDLSLWGSSRKFLPLGYCLKDPLKCPGFAVQQRRRVFNIILSCISCLAN